MSQHRQHYFEANFRPEQDLRPESRIGRTLAIALVAISSLAAAVSINFQPATSTAPVVTPVRSPVVEQFELQPIEVEDARIEGFRAGYTTAMEQQGCATVLSSPLPAAR